MNAYGSSIERLFHEKILLYQDLLDVLEQEKKAIMDIDLDALWKISDKKQKTALKLEAVRSNILDTLTRASISHDMDAASFQPSKILPLLPEKTAERLQKVNVTLVALKNDIQGLLTENKRFVGEYLGVLDELIGIITNVEHSKPVYGKNTHPQNMATNVFLHREV